MAKPIFERKNILISGGAGFLGSHLSDLLVQSNKVICIDNFKTGSVENINHLLKHPDFEFVKHDLSQPINLEELPELKVFKVAFQGIQQIYHLASPTSPAAYQRYPVETIVANTIATKNALDLAVKYQASFILFSTDAVYGVPTEAKPIPENYWGYVDQLGSDSAFAEGKRAAETLVFHYRKAYNLDAKIVRLFPVYGPRLQIQDGRLVPELIRQALAGGTITVPGPADTKVSLTYYTDILDAVTRIMDSHEAGPINLGNDSLLTLRELTETIITLTQSQAQVVYSDKPHELYRLPSIQRARQRLGWFPVISLERGLQETIDYLRSLRVEHTLTTNT